MSTPGLLEFPPLPPLLLLYQILAENPRIAAAAAAATAVWPFCS